MLGAWWPNGYGEQPLYDITVEFESKNDVESKTIAIGFRTAELVQEPIDKNDPKMGMTRIYESILFIVKFYT